MISLLFTTLGLAGNVASSVMQGNRLSAQNEVLNKQLNDLNSWYKSSRSESLVDNSEVKGVIRQQKLEERDKNRIVANNVSRENMTPEKHVAIASANNQKWGDNLAAIASGTSAYQKDVEDKYLSQSATLNRHIASTSAGGADSISNATKSALELLNLYLPIL